MASMIEFHVIRLSMDVIAYCKLKESHKASSGTRPFCLLYKKGTIKGYNQSQIYGFIPLPVQDSDFESDFSNLLVMI